MTTNRQNNEESASGSTDSAPAAKDGLIDFSTFSTEQLTYLKDSINPSTHPQDLRNVIEELARRELNASEAADTAREYPVRFTSRGGLAGWVNSLYRRIPLHGAGTIGFEADDVVFRGWQRTWLGVPLQAEMRIASRHIRNVVREGAWVKFELHPDAGRRSRMQLQAASEELGQSLVEQLPRLCSEGFETSWQQLQAFDQGVQLAAPRVWAAPTLVILNSLVFAAMLAAGSGFWITDLELATRWGSNFGLLTSDGQWWRLFSSLFLHQGFMHLLFNMWALWGAGRLAERLYGSAAFLFIYAGAGVAASLSSIAWNPLINSVGASGAIFGILGACLVFLMRRDTRVPASIVKAQGLSMAAFVLFNLVNGFTTTNIDNAAHVGGLIAGCLFGWMLARPLDPEVRVRLAGMRATAACVAVLAILVAGFWQMHALRSTRSAPERYWIDHQWLLAGQLELLRTAGELQARANTGSLSRSEFIKGMEDKVLGFWQAADARLLEEPQLQDPQTRQFATMVAEYVRLRQEAATAFLDGIRNDDRSRSADGAEYTASAEKLLARITRLELRSRFGRVQSLSQSALAKSVRGAFAGLRWRCITPQTMEEAEALDMSASDGAMGRIASGCAAQRAFESADYEALDEMLHPRAGHIADLDDGSSRLSGIASGLGDLFNVPTAQDRVLSQLADWRAERPRSDGPDLVEALFFREWAWSVRGGGFAESVSPQQWALFEQRVEMAAAALEDAARSATRSPVWYQLMLQLGVDRSRRRTELRAVFDAGIAAYPDYDGLHSGLLRALLPRWGGSYEEVDNFIAERVRNAPAGSGPEVYARLYSVVAAFEGDDTDIFKDAYAQWPLMKQGFDAMLVRYPTSPSIRNRYAFSACRAQDAAAYASARAAINGSVIQSGWTRKFSPAFCDESLLKSPATTIWSPTQ